MADPSISVVMLCRNNPEIFTSIDVVVRQLEESDELIVVDDCSDVRYREGLQQLQKRGFLKVLETKIVGNRSHNRNLGASISTGNFILFLDGDIVILDDALDNVRRACKASPAPAFVGHVHAAKYCENTFSLYSGIDDFVEQVRTPCGRKLIRDNPLLSDKRFIALNQDRELDRYNWLNYYSAACIIENSLFKRLGGFDERFHNWGCEDVDLGFRICRAGYPIQFLEGFHSIHVPHQRNALKSEISNWENKKYAVMKHLCWEWEAIATFRFFVQAIAGIDEIIRSMRLLPLPSLKPSGALSSLYIETVSRSHPNGNIVFVDSEGTKTTLNMLGLMLPGFEEQSVETCYVSSNVYIYPPTLTAEVLREANRVAMRVYIVDTEDRTRIDWQPIVNSFVFTHREHDGRRCHDIMEYSYTYEDALLRVTPQMVD